MLAQHTLGNGMNALDYFHQLVKIITPSGTILDPKQGVVGVRQGTVQLAEAAPQSPPTVESGQ